ncbi:hypothetical protein SteCoe_38949 [Stentor coeruleus]|uniref:Uncharacterized protein n=1 Tax=Stentor coeruleus TaxID=5963 RepID=A0A1R2AKY0_9CILI|nr:hypothetical protein SteCoe_38949 [Stentor coeruleus]
MGNDTSSDLNIDIPELYYLYRKKSTLLHIRSGVITKLKFSKKLKVRSDSAIGYLPNRKIMICGGTDSSDCLTNKTLILDPINLKIINASNLPYPSRNGFLIEFRDWVYYAGSVTEGDLEDDEAEVEIPSKLFRYNLRENFWEKINENTLTGKEEQKDSKAKYPTLNDLFLPQVFIFSGKLYFLGGRLRSSSGKFKTNHKFFSMDLTDETFTLKNEKIKLPFPVKDPFCLCRGSDVLITGGANGKEFNRQCWSMNIVKRKAEFVELPEINVGNIDKHPGVYTGLVSVVFSFPEITFLENKGKAWEKILVVQKNDKAPTPELNKFMVMEEKKEKRVIKAGVKGPDKNIFVKKNEESDSEEEKINPFPNLESLRANKKPSAFETDSD